MRMTRWFLPVASVCLLSGVLMAAQGEQQPDEKRSGLDYVSPETRAMQEDDTSNPGMLWVLDGEAPTANIIFHSSELMPGGSPYNQTDADVDHFYDELEALLAFLTEGGATGATFASFKSHQ